MIQTLEGENKSLILRSNHASKEFLSKLEQLRQQDHLIDIILTTEDGKQVKAHKIVHHKFFNTDIVILLPTAEGSSGNCNPEYQLSSRVATSQLKEPRVMKVDTRGCNSR